MRDATHRPAAGTLTDELTDVSVFACPGCSAAGTREGIDTGNAWTDPSAVRNVNSSEVGTGVSGEGEVDRLRAPRWPSRPASPRADFAEATIVAVLPDTGERYLSAGVFGPNPA